METLKTLKNELKKATKKILVDVSLYMYWDNRLKYINKFLETRNGYAVTVSKNIGGVYPDVTIYFNKNKEFITSKADAKWAEATLIKLELKHSKENFYIKIYKNFYAHFPEGKNEYWHYQNSTPRTGVEKNKNFDAKELKMYEWTLEQFYKK